MTLVATTEDSTDVCYRCGYDLRTLADEQPCPECGLLAARSRRPSDELHHTRPGWLRKLSLGVWLILLAIVVAFGWAFGQEWLRERLDRGAVGATLYYALRLHGPFIGIDVTVLILAAGVWLLTVREGYAAADAKDRWRRRTLRVLAVLPILLLLVQHLLTQRQVMMVTRGGFYESDVDRMVLIGTAAMCLVLAPLPLLLFFQLRSLAKRARSASLAEHCAIVGVGNTLTLLYVPVLMVVYEFAEDWGMGMYWSARSSVSLGLLAALLVASFLFAMWSVYLLVRFAIAFAKASRMLRTAWRRDDLSVAPAM